MKPSQSKTIIEDCKKRGYVLINDTLYPPNSDQAKEFVSVTSHTTKKNKSGLNRLKTGFIDDSRNIRNKETRFDTFTKLISQELQIECWPEFYFLTDRQYRFDYAIPVSKNLMVLKIAIEVEGGIWARGNSGHSSGKGIARDMDKGTLANVNGWTLIRRTPSQLMTNETLNLIKKAIELKIA